MKEFSFTAMYRDTREIYIMAENLEDAQEIMDSGSWDIGNELTIDFELVDIVKELHEVK